jgi:hypothetical protein
MAMKLLTFHNQLVAFLPPDDQDDNFVTFDIIQDTQVSRPKFELGQRVRTQALDRFRGRRGLVLQPGQNSRFQDSLIPRRQAPELSLRVVGDRNLESHGGASTQTARTVLRSTQTGTLLLASPHPQDIPFFIEMNPQRCVRHPQFKWNLLHGNVSRSAAVSNADPRVQDDPDLPWDQAREHNRRDALKPLTRVCEFSCHDQGG